MIRLCDDSRTTPKQKAREILMDNVSIALGYWTEQDSVVDQMTDGEIELVKAQLQKQADRVAKLLGYEEAWHS